jgi:hypothetical protein
MLIFSLKRVPLRARLPYPGGLNHSLRPILPLLVFGPTTSHKVEFIADTAADSVIVPEFYAPQIGIDLTRAYSGSAVGVGSGTVSVRYALVLLELDDGVTQYRWRTHVGFAPVQHALFGATGGLEFFRSTIDYATEELMMNPQGTLPITSDSIP